MNNKHITQIRVRYGETDQMGVVHHSNYARYFEMARIDWLEAFGISYKSMEADGIQLPVYEMKIRFKKPAFFDDRLTVETFLKEKPAARIVFAYVVKDVQGEILTEAETTLVFTDKTTRRPIRCPDAVLCVLWPD